MVNEIVRFGGLKFFIMILRELRVKCVIGLGKLKDERKW
jgi:hypothetical protein